MATDDIFHSNFYRDKSETKEIKQGHRYQRNYVGQWILVVTWLVEPDAAPRPLCSSSESHPLKESFVSVSTAITSVRSFNSFEFSSYCFSRSLRADIAFKAANLSIISSPELWRLLGVLNPWLITRTIFKFFFQFYIFHKDKHNDVR